MQKLQLHVLVLVCTVKNELNHQEIVTNHKEKALQVENLKKKISATRLILHELYYDYSDVKPEESSCKFID